MTTVDQEHYLIAKQLSPQGEEFDRTTFFRTYLQQYSDRAPGSILPADYAESRDPITGELLNISVQHKPKFLERVGTGRSGKYRRIK